MYEPEENPLQDLNESNKIDAEEIERIVWDYMCMWDDEQDFRDISKIVEAGDDEMLAAYLVGAGAIDSKHCVKTCRDIEKRIERKAAVFNKLSNADNRRRNDMVFCDCTIYVCQSCGHHHFVNENDCVDDEIMATCCQCDGPTDAHKWGDEW